MTMMPADEPLVTGGVDTHKDQHTLAAINPRGELLGACEVPTTRAGHAQALAWLRRFGCLERVGIEQTGSYGAGIHRFLVDHDVEVVAVDRPDPQDRRRRGKDDHLDAHGAALAALEQRRTATPKDTRGRVEALRTLRLARAGAVKAKRAALQLLHNQIISASDDVRDALRDLTRAKLLKTCAAFRPDPARAHEPATAVRIALRSLARRIAELDDEIHELDEPITALIQAINPALLAQTGVGSEIAGQLLVSAGENPDRMRSEASFAMLCGTAPLPASSGKTQRHRLNRGGDRGANRALHLAVITRMRVDARTQAYVARRTAEGRSKREIIRCLKRYLARELFPLITISRSLA
jgi:transposase